MREGGAGFCRCRSMLKIPRLRWIGHAFPYWALLVSAWVWAIWSCAEYWRANPNYSYGWIVPALTFVYGARRLALTQSESSSRPAVVVPVSLALFFGIVAGALVFGLEFAREPYLLTITFIWQTRFDQHDFSRLFCGF